MNVRIHPGQPLSFAVAQPSYDGTLKAIYLSALCKSVSRIDCPDLSDDVFALLGAIKTIGAGFMHTEGGLLVSGIDVNRPVRDEHIHISVGRSIPVLCLMLPLATYLYTAVTFDCDAENITHLKAYEDIYTQRGFYFEYGENSLTVSGRLTGGEYMSSYPITFPFFDGLMMFSATLEENSRIYYSSAESFPSYAAHTLSYMELFGAKALISSESIEISGRQKYHGRNVKPEKDYLKASQLMFLGSIKGGSEIYGFDDENIFCPNACVVDIMQRCGIPAEQSGTGIRIPQTYMPPVSADLGKYPDIIPIMMVRCAFSEGYSVIKGADKVKYDEYSRITGLIYELRKSGVDIGIEGGSIVIKGTGFYYGSEFYTHSDPLIASALGIFAACCVSPSVINGAEAVNRRYPDIWEDLRSMGITVEEI